MTVTRLGLVGLGKIARDQHLPAIARDARFDLVATVDPVGALPDVPAWRDMAGMIAAGGVDAVAICTPPGIRHALALEAIDGGLHVLLEKPPAASVDLARDIAERAQARGVTAFAAWHSREAAGVAPARAWLAGRRINQVRIVWREDIRRWHPGQDWILEADGFGVFDPAINAFSILTRLIAGPVVAEAATLSIPANRRAPIAADLRYRIADTVHVDVDLDFLEADAPAWTIHIATDRGTCTLIDGGARFVGPDDTAQPEGQGEYPRLYARFADLIAAGVSDVDVAPLAMATDALRIGARRTVDAFAF